MYKEELFFYDSAEEARARFSGERQELDFPIKESSFTAEDKIIQGLEKYADLLEGLT